MSTSSFSYNIDSYIYGPFRNHDDALDKFNEHIDNSQWDGDLMLGSTSDGLYYIFESNDVCDSSSDSEEISELTTEGQVFIESVTTMVH